MEVMALGAEVEGFHRVRRVELGLRMPGSGLEVRGREAEMGASHRVERIGVGLRVAERRVEVTVQEAAAGESHYFREEMTCWSCALLSFLRRRSCHELERAYGGFAKTSLKLDCEIRRRLSMCCRLITRPCRITSSMVETP